MSNKHSGSTFDSFLEEENLLEDVEAVVAKRVACVAAETSNTGEEDDKATFFL